MWGLKVGKKIKIKIKKKKKNLQPIQERMLKGSFFFFFFFKINDFQPVKIYAKKRLKNSLEKKA